MCDHFQKLSFQQFHWRYIMRDIHCAQCGYEMRIPIWLKVVFYLVVWSVWAISILMSVEYANRPQTLPIALIALAAWALAMRWLGYRAYLYQYQREEKRGMM